MKMNEFKPIATLIAVIFFGIVAYLYNGTNGSTVSAVPATTPATQVKPVAAFENKAINITKCPPPTCVTDAKNLIKTLPFVIEEITLNDSFKDDHKLVRIEAGVHGGTRMEWAATSVAIAEIASRTEVDSIEVLLNRNEIPIEKSKTYRELSHIYYAPDPEYSVWGDALKDKWEIYIAQKKDIATEKDIEVNDYFDKINQEQIDSGIDHNKADEKAAIMTAKKFHLKSDFTLFSGNLNENDDGMKREEIHIAHDNNNASLNALNECLSAENINVNSCNKKK